MPELCFQQAAAGQELALGLSHTRVLGLSVWLISFLLAKQT